MAEYIVYSASGWEQQRVTLDAGTLTLRTIESGNVIKRVELSDVTVLRLNPAVPSKAGPGHYLCTLVERSGERTRLRAEARNRPICAEYRRLVTDLHKHFLGSATPPAFRTGLARSWGFWLFALGFGAAMMLLVAAAVCGTTKKKNYTAGAAFISVTLALMVGVLWYAKKMLMPRVYDPKEEAWGLLP